MARLTDKQKKFLFASGILGGALLVGRRSIAKSYKAIKKSTFGSSRKQVTDSIKKNIERRTAAHKTRNKGGRKYTEYGYNPPKKRFRPAKARNRSVMRRYGRIQKVLDKREKQLKNRDWFLNNVIKNAVS